MAALPETPLEDGLEADPGTLAIGLVYRMWYLGTCYRRGLINSILICESGQSSRVHWTEKSTEHFMCSLHVCLVNTCQQNKAAILLRARLQYVSIV